MTVNSHECARRVHGSSPNPRNAGEPLVWETSSSDDDGAETRGDDDDAVIARNVL